MQRYKPGCELRHNGVLGSSPKRSSPKFAKEVVKILQLSDAPAPFTGVCCVHHVLRGRHVKTQDRYLPSF